MTSLGTGYASLGAARGSIGQAQSSLTFTVTQTIRVASLDRNNAILMTTLGLAAIMSAFQEASMFYTYTNGYFGHKKMRVASEALTFIQGTGLDICIQEYGLDYDPYHLRESFFRKFHVKA